MVRERNSAAQVAREIARLRSEVAAMSRARQVSRSDVSVVVDGETVAVPIPELLQQSVVTHTEVIQAQADLVEAAENVAVLRDTITQIEDGTLPALQEAIDIAQATADSTVSVHFEADLGEGVYPSLNDTSERGDLYYRLDGQVERWQGSALGWTLVKDTQLAAAIQGLADAEAALDALNTVTLPGLTTDLDAAKAAILSHTTDLGTLDGRLAEAEGEVDSLTKPGGTLAQMSTTIGQKLSDVPNAVKETHITDDAITTAKIKANAVTAGEVAADAIYAGAIQANAVTADKIKAGEVVAGKLAANSVVAANIMGGTITGDKIAGRTIAAEQLLVTPSNVFPDPLFQATGKWSGTDVSVVTDPDFRDGNALEINTQTAQRGSYYGASNNFVSEVEPGATYRLRMTIKATGNVGQKLRLYCRGANAAGTTVTNTSDLVSPTLGTNVYETDLSVSPTMAGLVNFGLYTVSPYVAGGTYRITGVSLLRKAGGTLIEDGAVTTEKVKADAITANELAVGAITAGKAIIGEGAIKSAMIGDAQIINAHVEGLSAQKITTDTLGADRIGARTITAEKLLVGSFENLIADVQRDTGTIHPHAIGSQATSMYVANPITVGGLNPGKHIYAVASAGTNQYIVTWGGTEGGHTIAVEPNTEYHASVLAAAYAGTHDLSWVIREYDADGTAITFRGIGGWQAVNSTGWATVGASFTTGSTVTRLAIYSRVNAASGTRLVNPTLRRKSGGEVIVDGSITALKLGAKAVTAEKIDAGAVTSEKITGGDIIGKRFIGSTYIVTDSEGAEMVNLSPGVGGNFATFGMGEQQATIGSDGSVSASVGSFDRVDIGGKAFVDWIRDMPRGVVFDGTFATPNVSSSTAQHQAFFGGTFWAEPGRKYLVTCETQGDFYVFKSGSFDLYADVRVYNSETLMPGLTTNKTSQIYYDLAAGPGGLNDVFSFSRVFTTESGADDGTRLPAGYATFLGKITSLHGAGQNWSSRAWGKGGRFTVTDVGPADAPVDISRFENSGNTGGGDLPPTPKATTYTKEYGATWSQSYMGSNGQRSGGDGGKCYQGYTSYWSGGGTQKSLIGFNDSAIRSDIAGAEIEYIDVYLNFEHWNYGSGGSAGIGAHGHASKPSSFSGSTSILKQEGNWPRGGGRWVRLPSSEHARWQSGASRGISLQAPSTSALYYGIATGAGGGSKAPKIRIKYKK